jgi:uncharacterized protein (TIGR02453 family)
MATRYFTRATFDFLKDLEENNNRAWFQENKHRYEEHVRDSSIRFITDFGPRLKKISEHFRADPRTVGGSLFRIYRDTRFSKDKRPYKTMIGIHFRHELGKDAHAPGFYLHVERNGCFVGAGIWHPDSKSLHGIRSAIVEDPQAWKRPTGGKRFRDLYALEGDRLKRPPRGFDPAHPLIEELKRKDFIGVAKIPQKMITGPDLTREIANIFTAATPVARFLCGALAAPF